MSKARISSRKLALAEKYLAESNKGRTLSNVLDSDAEVRAARLAEAKLGARLKLEGTMERNQLLNLRDSMEKARSRQTTDSNN